MCMGMCVCIYPCTNDYNKFPSTKIISLLSNEEKNGKVNVMFQATNTQQRKSGFFSRSVIL